MSYNHTVSDYHTLKATLKTTPDSNVALECVYCMDLLTSTVPGPSVSYNPAADNSHEAHVLPCGHFMGKSCIVRAPADKCRACHTLFRRDPAKDCCSHAIELPRMKGTRLLSPEQEEYLLPTLISAYMPEHCRTCATLPRLQQLTTFAREGIQAESAEKPHQARQLVDGVYATDGKVHGFLDGDYLEPFKELDIQVAPPLISEDLVQMALGYQKDIRWSYDGITPPAENKIAGDVFMFKVAAYTNEPWQREQQRDGV